MRSRLTRSAVTASLSVVALLGSVSSAGAAGGGFGPPPSGSIAVQPLAHPCMTGMPQDLCQNIGTTEGWYEGHTVRFLYTQNYYCDPSVSAGSSNGCEVGAKYKHVPPGTTSDAFTDPLYIPVPLFAPAPGHLQCPAGPCVDHPMTIDLTRIAGALGVPASKLKNVPLPGHDHLIADRNFNRPEWWPVYVIGVTNPCSFQKIEQAKSFAEAQKLAKDPKNGVTAPIPTNVFLWFQTLQGSLD
ncbi:hypothetical protein [Streptacidiphilus jiangxiensis]|uniref:Uncharacterized protein n=1 Tax=Streptacidiphilus jiangxiensis TaxID=235985 RepID=A0A1H7HBG9_STRJI|nr:hypothetical protein [Streptacidiphilus jiangxiensis]SEK47776.1 hypothetical protein SAMN05414137_102153 [Streptacidiphilus jiangxiensis]